MSDTRLVPPSAVRAVIDLDPHVLEQAAIGNLFAQQEIAKAVWQALGSPVGAS